MSVETGAGTRIAALDVLRGVAILGTFASNAWLFAAVGGPGALLVGGDTPGGGGAETVLLALSNGKFLALLTLLFGVGVELQYRSAVRRGLRWPGRYLLRALVLFVEGLVHYVLVFEFDVLMGYAIASFAVAHLVGRSERVITAWMWVVGTGYALVVVGLTAVLVLAPDETGGDPGIGFPAETWPEQVVRRLVLFPLFRIELLLIVPSAVVLFLAGSRLARAGAFAAGGTGIRRRLAVVGLGAGVPLNALTTALGPDWFLVDRYLVPPLVALGLLGLVTEIVHRTRGGVLRRGLAAVGRTALSCYVLQNVVASVLCLSWGFGLADAFAGDARTVFVVGLWVGVSALMLVLAPLWLRRFDRGPLEVVTHALVRRRSH